LNVLSGINSTIQAGDGWDYLILDPDPPVSDLGSQSIGDIDGDGSFEIISGGSTGLLWHRPATFERGVISTGVHQVGSALADLDRDGLLEVVVAERDLSDNAWMLTWLNRNGSSPSHGSGTCWIRKLLPAPMI
jgi:hypothetical protein